MSTDSATDWLTDSGTFFALKCIPIVDFTQNYTMLIFQQQKLDWFDQHLAIQFSQFQEGRSKILKDQHGED